MKFKKILLISPRFYKGRYRLAIHPVVGLGYIAEALSRAGCMVKVLDMNLQYDFRDLERILLDFKPDLIGFTVMTFGHRELYGMIERVKRLCPGAKIVAGGPHISMLREKVLRDCGAIDYGIVLEGDRSIVDLCHGTAEERIQGLIYRAGERVTMNRFETFIEDLDSIPFPRYEAFELEKYPARQIGIFTSRGCPYDCIYCPVISAIGKRFRMRSARSVADEIDYWHARGYRVIMILDDNFTLQRSRVEEICALIRQKGYKDLKLRCPNGIRADKVDRQLLKTMREAGFDLVAFGVEAASDRVLERIKKGESLKEIEASIKDACDLGFEVELFFLIGSPGETMEDVKRSFDLALRYPVSLAKFYNIIPFPTTELFAWVVKNGLLLRPQEEILNNASHFVNRPSFYTPEMSEAERKAAFRMAQKVAMRIRRRSIERKIGGGVLFRKAVSMLYTVPAVEHLLTNNRFIVKTKERLKEASARK